jgi:hypothetical protein
MKKLTTVLLLCIGFITYGQVIDYNNFDSELAEKVLFEEFNKFRDTITIDGVGNKIDDLYPDQKLRRLIWSDNVRDLLAYPNNEVWKHYKDSVFHVNCKKFWLNPDNLEPFMEEYRAKTNHRVNKLTNIIRSENAFVLYGYKGDQILKRYPTYQSLAKYAIRSWDRSPSHRKAQRQRFYSIRTYNELQALMGHSIIYNENNNNVYIVMNFVFYR